MPAPQTGEPTVVRIPLATPNLSDADRAAVSAALESTDIAYGPVVRKFESAIGERLGVPHAIAVCSGTAALHLALLAVGVGPGDEVLVPSLTYVAPANAVRGMGAHPVFVDSEPAFRQIDAERVAAFLERSFERRDGGTHSRRTGRRLRAIVAVDLLGHPCDVDALLDVGRRWDLAVVDDAAEALGGTIRDRPIGSVAPVSVLSFNANKIITSGGGGMVLCHDEEVAEDVKRWATHGRRAGTTAYLHDVVGFNYLMPAAQAALGHSQLGRLDTFLEDKRATAARYAERFACHPDVTLPAQAPWARSTAWLYTVQVPEAARDHVLEALAREGIQARPMFRPMHTLDAHAGAFADACPVAERLAATGLSLPCSTSIGPDAIDEVADRVAAHLADVA